MHLVQVLSEACEGLQDRLTVVMRQRPRLRFLLAGIVLLWSGNVSYGSVDTLAGPGRSLKQFGKTLTTQDRLEC